MWPGILHPSEYKQNRYTGLQKQKSKNKLVQGIHI